jgi:ribosomal protein S12 methylthiotransferase
VIADGAAEPGTFVTCEVTEAHPYDLVVRLVDRERTTDGVNRPEHLAVSP